MSTKPAEVTAFEGRPKCPHGVPKEHIRKMSAQWWEARDCKACMDAIMAEDKGSSYQIRDVLESEADE